MRRIAVLAVALLAVTTTIRIPQAVLASGKPLDAGTYEVRVTDEHPVLANGTPNETQRWVEIVANGTVVAREIAEVAPAAEQPVGTSSASARPRTVVQLLKGGDFLRISVSDANGRYLVYLPVSQP